MSEPAPRSLLLVDADTRSRAALGRRIEAGGFRATATATAEHALQRAGEIRFDAALIEIALPDMDGRDLCRLLQRRGARCPIVLMGKSANDADEVLSLDSGAVDYMAKPLAPEVLLARLRAHLRGHARRDDATLALGRFAFQVGQKLLVDATGSDTIKLTGSEAAILKHLYRAQDHVAAREDLVSDVLGYCGAARTHTLETHVYRLRQKIEHDPTRPQLLLTIDGGYRLAIDGMRPS